MHAAFLRTYRLKRNDVPLLRYDPKNGLEPFALVG